jgi:hypothetical protein
VDLLRVSALIAGRLANTIEGKKYVEYDMRYRQLNEKAALDGEGLER